MTSISRRELLQAVLGTSSLALAGCNRTALPPEGDYLAQDFALGHRLRDPAALATVPTDWQTVPVVIVGAGIAGLAAGWRLLKQGFRDFVVLDLEREAGGTSRSGSSGRFQFPWAAHYITTPLADNLELIELLQEMQLVERLDQDGSPIIAEQYLCRDPEERLFQNGTWIEGLYPALEATEDDQRQMQEFQLSMRQWSQRRDANGQRAFTIPLARCSTADEFLQIDQLSMAEWIRQQGWTSARLRWYIDYACRDDYGLTIDRTSAWAGIFYFASRLRSDRGESQDVITWPPGNGRIVQHLSQRLADQLRTGQLVVRISPTDPTQPEAQRMTQRLEDDHNADSRIYLTTLDGQTGAMRGITASRVIFAGPQFVAQRVIDGMAERKTSNFQYSSWLVANLHLSGRPQASGFPICWDNVFYDSPSLGYVVSTHQSGIDHGPTVITWYYPFASLEGKLSRDQLLRLEWSEWADLALTDIEQAHPDIRKLVKRIDIMRWGHAMIEPRPNFVWSDARRSAAQPLGAVHFANTDLSGIALLEEAFYHGVRAADEVLAQLPIK